MREDLSVNIEAYFTISGIDDRMFPPDHPNTARIKGYTDARQALALTQYLYPGVSTLRVDQHFFLRQDDGSLKAFCWMPPQEGTYTKILEA
jgi:hypothetical protein